MTLRNRETLRNYFGDGKLPTRYTSVTSSTRCST